MAVDVNSLRHAHDHGLTVGVIPANGVQRTRLEIDEFIKKTDTANLYLLALIDLQRLDNWKDRFSYFQIAGIHGKPFVPWDGVRPQDGRPPFAYLEKDDEARPTHEPNMNSGYCSHGSNLFPTWHRAYLAMLEQTIFLKMVEIAERFPQSHRQRYLNATVEFGLPYWDPFLPRRRVTNRYGYPIYKCGVPIIMMITQVMVRESTRPNELVPVANPLYAYQFPLERAPWANDVHFSWKDMFEDVLQTPSMALHTIRGLSPAGTTDHTFLNNTLTNAVSQTNGPALPLGGKIYRVLNGPTLTYTQMSNSAFVEQRTSEKARSQNRENSLEGFHNDIHTMCGTGLGGRLGHMALNEFAAFDPIFFLHHTNIDRIFAIWQALNDSDQEWDWHQALLERGSFVTPVGTNETPRSPLVPFRKHWHQDGTALWWTSNDLRHCRSLGYTYPELVSTHSDVRLLRQWVIDNYEWTTLSGDPPPLDSVFNTEDLEGVKAFPDLLLIDGRGPPVEIPKEKHVYGREIRSSTKSIFEALISCFRRSNKRNAAHTRYKHLKGLIHDGKLTNWNATIRVQKFALGGSFTIFLFLGDFDPDPRAWHHDSRLVGIDGIFANRNIERCDNCRQQHENGMVDSDVIPLTTPLIAYYRSHEPICGMKLKSLDEEHVVPFLKRNLHWRILDAAGRQYEHRQVPSLRIDIGSQAVRLPYEMGAMPVYEDEFLHFSLTYHD